MIENRSALLDVPKRCAKQREILLDAAEYAIKSVHPSKVIPENLKIEGDALLVRGTEFPIKGRLALFGIGKAGYHMSKAVNDILGDRIDFGLVNSIKDGEIGKIELMKASHPFPDESTVKNTEKMVRCAENLREEDTALVLISGGGSSMFCLPEDGVSIRDMREISGRIMSEGGNIWELNTVRRSLSRVKGGGFAAVLRPARIISLIISDVVDNHLPSIASGPTVKVDSEASEAERILRKYGIWERLSGDVKNAVRREKMRDEADMNLIIADNDTAVHAASISLASEGIDHQLYRRFAGNVEELADVAANARMPVIIGGEASSVVRGEGKGGRAQETVLRAILKGFKGSVLSIGTDGMDGNSGYAGAIADACLLERMRERGFEPLDFLKNSDSSRFFEKSGAAIKTGYTGTNVADITLLFPQKAI